MQRGISRKRSHHVREKRLGPLDVQAVVKTEAHTYKRTYAWFMSYLAQYTPKY